jgi:hypothetical protein
MEGPEMLAYVARLIVFAVVTFTAIPSSADWLCDFFNSVARDTKRRNCWPAPFVCPDRQSTRTPFAIMVNNGWRKQNMLGDFYFEPSSGLLTEAGKLKIRWIIVEAPEQHRQIFVHIGLSPEETEARMAAVNTYASSIALDGNVPPITQTSISDYGTPASRVDLIDRKYQASMPAPRLPAQAIGGSSSSTGGQ